MVVERRASLSLAFPVLPEAFTPPERAVFLLREIVDYHYAELDSMLKIPVAACRQLFHRGQSHRGQSHLTARPHRAAGRHCLSVSPQMQLRLVDSLLAATDTPSRAQRAGPIAPMPRI